MAYLMRDGGQPRIADFPLVAMVIAIVLYAAATALAVSITGMVPAAPHGLDDAIKACIVVAFGYAAYKLAIRHLGEQPRDDLPVRGAIGGLSIGLLSGFLLFSAVAGTAAILGAYEVVGCCSTTQLVSDLFSAAIVPGFMEELLFRGILFRWFEEFAGSWAALIVTSALFGFAHSMNPGATWFSSFAVALEGGVLLGGAYMLTRSLWMSIGLHAAWNFTQGFIFDVPVSGVDAEGLVTARLSGPALLSGGSFGLEASLIALVFATLFGAALFVLAARRGRLVQPWWVRRRALTQA
jgi:membrane protease YdiL (CAAX protease family)